MKIVIIGGGFCGSILAKKLGREERFDTVLIDRKDEYQYYPALPELLSDPSISGKISLRYDSFLTGVEFIRREVKRITPEAVVTDKGRISYDRCVLCFGAEYPVRLDNKNNVYTVDDIENTLKTRKALHDSDHVLIIGGGLIGVEVAAEIADQLEKRITLVHPHQRLLERTPMEASEHAERFLHSRGVEIIFNDKVVENRDLFLTDKGNKIDADMAVWAGGLGFHRELLSGFDHDIFSEPWGLDVNSDLKLKHHEDIYVGGDITSLNEEKTGHNADVHGKFIFKDLIREMEGKGTLKYSTQKAPMIIGLGRKDGIVVFEGKILTGRPAATVKKMVEIGALRRLRF